MRFAGKSYILILKPGRRVRPDASAQTERMKKAMKFRYLGTAAAEGWPAVFCNCDHCHRAKKAGGRNIRTRSQALINDDLLIDFPSDSYHHALHCLSLIHICP